MTDLQVGHVVDAKVNIHSDHIVIDSSPSNIWARASVVGQADGHRGWLVKFDDPQYADGARSIDELHRISYHASARDARGAYLPDRVWGWDMPIYGDFYDLAKAEQWAEELLTGGDVRIDHVAIRESVQEHPGQSWRAGRHVTTVSRATAGDPR